MSIRNPERDALRSETLLCSMQLGSVCWPAHSTVNASAWRLSANFGAALAEHLEESDEAAGAGEHHGHIQ